jgi:hypothetical protein
MLRVAWSLQTAEHFFCHIFFLAVMKYNIAKCCKTLMQCQQLLFPDGRLTASSAWHGFSLIGFCPVAVLVVDVCQDAL